MTKKSDKEDAEPRESKLRAHLARMYGVDERGLIIFRVALGLVLFYDVLERTGLAAGRTNDATIFFSDLGLITRQDVESWSFCIFSGTGTPSIVWLLFIVAAITDLCFVFGYNTKTAALFSLLIHIGAYFRSPNTRIGADVFAARCLFFVACDPHLPIEGRQPKPDEKRTKISRPHVLTMGAAALVISQSLVYLGAGLSKGKQAWWTNGTPLRDVLESPFYGRGGLVGGFLLSLPTSMQVGFTSGAVLGEIGAGLLIMFPLYRPELCRTVGFIIVLGLQFGLFITMRLGPFPFYSMACMLPVLPRQVWDFVLPDKCDIHLWHVECTLATQSLFNRCVKKCADLFRSTFVFLALLWITVTMFQQFPGCNDDNVFSFGCALPKAVRTLNGFQIPQEWKQTFEFFGLMPNAFDMFHVPRSDHGWLAVIAEEDKSLEKIYLPTAKPALSAAEAFSRPHADWFPTMRWRQFWFAISASEGAKGRSQMASYFCRHPPVAGKRLSRIQFYWTANALNGWGDKVIDYPLARPSLVLNWFCNQEMVDRQKKGECPECDEWILPIPPPGDATPGPSSNQSQSKEEI